MTKTADYNWQSFHFNLELPIQRIRKKIHM